MRHAILLAAGLAASLPAGGAVRALDSVTRDRVLYRAASGKMILPCNLYR